MGESSPDKNTWARVRQIKIYRREFARYNILARVCQTKYMGESSPDVIFMGECSSDVNYHGIIVMNIVTNMCGRVFAKYCIFLDNSYRGIKDTLIVMDIVHMCGRVFAEYCVGKCYVNMITIMKSPSD